MSKNNIVLFKNVTTTNPLTPEMLEAKPKAYDAEMVKAVKDISKAQSTADKAGYTVAYNLYLLNKKRKDGAYIKRMGYKNISDYAERFHNLAGASALAYAQTAEQLLVKDDFGIHSPLANIDETGKIVNDFTVSQLMELRNADTDVIDGLLALGSYTYADTTKALRFKTSIVKALTTAPKDGKVNEYYRANITVPEIHEILLSAGALLLENKGISGMKALEMLTHPDSADNTPDSADSADSADSTPDSADSTPELDTSDGAVYKAIEDACKPFSEYASENADTALLNSLAETLDAFANAIRAQIAELNG